jgi:hypothetical protein
MTPENSGNNDVLYYILSGLFAAWALVWIVGLLRITH